MKSTGMTFCGLMLAAAATVLGGCASGNGGGHAGHSADSSGMMCPTCETVWVAPKGGGANPKVQAMTWGRGMVCPDCDAMAKAYFKDGKTVLHDCPSCKVAPRPATTVTPTHPKGTHG